MCEYVYAGVCAWRRVFMETSVDVRGLIALSPLGLETVLFIDLELTH